MLAAVDILARGEAMVRIVEDPDLAARLADRQREIAAIWQAARQRQPTLFDAPLPHYLGLTAVGAGTELRAARIRFSQLYAARRHPEWGLGLLPVGVSGATVSRNGQVVLARRSPTVSLYPDHWELAPSGHLCPTGEGPGVLDHRPGLLEELEQELGLTGDRVQETATLGILRDNQAAVVDVCCLLRVRATARDIEQALASAACSREYTAISFLPLSELSAFATAADSLVPTSRVLLRLIAAALAGG